MELDPNFALAHSELADCYALLNWFIGPAPAEAWQRAGIRHQGGGIESELAEAHASLGFVRLHYDRDWADAERELRKAILLRPTNRVAHRWYAYSLSAMGRHDEAVVEIERARDISPQSAVIARLWLMCSFWRDDTTKRSRSVSGRSIWIRVQWLRIRSCGGPMKGRHTEALATFEQERSLPAIRRRHAQSWRTFLAVGVMTKRAKCWKEFWRGGRRWVTAYEIAIIYAWLGDNINALRWLCKLEKDTPSDSLSCVLTRIWNPSDPILTSETCCAAPTKRSPNCLSLSPCCCSKTRSIFSLANRAHPARGDCSWTPLHPLA